MEKPSDKEIDPNTTQEQELSFDQQMVFAKTLFKAVDDRNVFIRRQGGFDTFAEVGQYGEGIRDAYNEMEKAVSEARQEFDEKISNKKEFIDKLKEIGEDELADTIAHMFSVSEKKKSRFF